MVLISSLENNFMVGQNSASICMKALDLYYKPTLKNYINFIKIINTVTKTEKKGNFKL